MRSLILCLSVLMLVAPVAAASPSESPARSGGTPPANYAFVPGDVVEITVSSHLGYDRTITIPPDGRIQFPFAGEIVAAGLTAAQLATRLQEALNAELVDPLVTVSLKELNKQAVRRVSVLGAVRNPGWFELKDGMTVAEALASGGGPTPLADLRRVTITRADQSVTTVDLAQADRTGRLERNVVLQTGDIIVVPQGAPPTVQVLGEVIKPGSYEIQGEARLLDAISLAGGPTTKADLRHVTLARSGPDGTRTLDLQPLLAGEEKAKRELNLPLQPGDTIVLVETDQRVYVLGRVARPDTYAIRPNDRVLDALARAGGATPDGDITKAVLVRRGEGGEPVAKPLDLKKMMAQGKMAENELLRPGDVVFVPDKRTRRSPGEIANLLWPITSLLNMFRN